MSYRHSLNNVFASAD